MYELWKGLCKMAKMQRHTWCNEVTVQKALPCFTELQCKRGIPRVHKSGSFYTITSSVMG